MIKNIRGEPRRGILYGLIVCYVTAILMMIGTVVYANYVNEESNRKWCGLVSSLDDAYSSSDTPPQTALGRQIAKEIKNIRIEFKC